MATIVSLALAYFVGLVATFISVREFAPTVLVGLTVLPIMLLVVLLPLGLAIAVVTAVLLAIISHVRERLVGGLGGAIIAVLLAELVLSVIANGIFGTEGSDFVDIVSHPLVSAAYGAILGGLTGLGFRRLASVVGCD